MARKTPFDPVGMMALGFEMTRLMIEAQTVITLRMMGMAGFWGRSHDEDHRMIAEKQAAFAKAGIAMWSAALQGRTGDKVANAGLRPLRRATKSNVTRLTRKGPRLPSAKPVPRRPRS